MNEIVPMLFTGLVVKLIDSLALVTVVTALLAMILPVPVTPPLKVIKLPPELLVEMVKLLLSVTAPLKVGLQSLASMKLVPEPPTLIGFAYVRVPPGCASQATAVKQPGVAAGIAESDRAASQPRDVAG